MRCTRNIIIIVGHILHVGSRILLLNVSQYNDQSAIKYLIKISRLADFDFQYLDLLNLPYYAVQLLNLILGLSRPNITYLKMANRFYFQKTRNIFTVRCIT